MFSSVGRYQQQQHRQHQSTSPRPPTGTHTTPGNNVTQQQQRIDRRWQLARQSLIESVAPQYGQYNITLYGLIRKRAMSRVAALQNIHEALTQRSGQVTTAARCRSSVITSSHFIYISGRWLTAARYNIQTDISDWCTRRSRAKTHDAMSLSKINNIPPARCLNEPARPITIQQSPFRRQPSVTLGRHGALIRSEHNDQQGRHSAYKRCQATNHRSRARFKISTEQRCGGQGQDATTTSPTTTFRMNSTIEQV